MPDRSARGAPVGPVVTAGIVTSGALDGRGPAGFGWIAGDGPTSGGPIPVSPT